jgi:hypothetical protein
MKDTMTPYEAFAFRIKHESTINALAGAAITTIVVTVLLTLILSPILLPLFLLELVVKGVRKTWNWFFPEPEQDETFAKVRAQFKKARAQK